MTLRSRGIKVGRFGTALAEPPMSHIRSTLCVLTIVFAAAPAYAASFDCAKARAADEKAICADRPLNDKDVRMALMYDLSRHFMAMGRRGVLEDEQTAWLRGRKACGANKQCLNGVYDHRIERLQGVLDEVSSHGPF
jgi:uncharacterized protein